MKKEIKTKTIDEKFQSFLNKGNKYIIAAISIVLIAGISFSIYFSVEANKQKKASDSYLEIFSKFDNLDTDISDEDFETIIVDFDDYKNNHKRTFLVSDFAFRIAQYYKKNNNFEKAIEYYNIGLENKAKNFQKSMILLNKANLLIEMGDIETAFDIYKKLQKEKEFPYLDYALLKLAQCYEHYDKVDEAINTYSKLIKNSNSIDLYQDSNTLEDLAKTRIMQINLGSQLFKFNEKEIELDSIDETEN